MKKIVFLVIGVMILTGIWLTTTPSIAEDDKTPDIPLWIEATYRIDFVNMTTMNVSATFAVHKICIDEQNLTADFIRDNYENLLGQGIVDKIMEEIDHSFNGTVNTTFRNDKVEWENTTFDNTSLTDTGPAGDEYQSPILFTKNATITFVQETFGFKKNNTKLKLGKVMEGTLKMGAVINKTFELKADAGYNNTFILNFTLSPDIKPTSPTDEDFLNTTVTWTVDNLKAESISDSITTPKSFMMESASPNNVTSEEVLINVTINMVDFDKIYLNGTVDIKSVDVDNYHVSIPKKYIKNLSFVSSDGIRMALDNGLVEWEDIKRETINITKDAEETLSDVFNTTIKLNFTWYNRSREGYDLSIMGSNRSINATFIALNETNETEPEKIEPNLFGDFDAETITGVLNAGAKYNFTVSSSEQNYTIKMILPTNMIFSDLSIPVKHTTFGKRNAYSWNSLETLTCKLESGIAPEYNESKALLNVLIDMHDVDIFSMALSIDFNADAQIYHIEMSDVGLPENLTMKYINSDCLRLLYDKGIIKHSDIDNITDEIKNALEENLTEAFNETVNIIIHRDKLNNSLLLDYDIYNMGDSRPLNISASAHISISLEQASSNKQAMALSFLTFPLDFTLSGMDVFNTTYKLILPKGINVIQASDSLGKLQQRTEEGRAYLTITLNETEEDDISITIDATGLMLNMILPFIILSIIMTATGIVVWLMRRKEGKLE